MPTLLALVLLLSGCAEQPNHQLFQEPARVLHPPAYIILGLGE